MSRAVATLLMVGALAACHGSGSGSPPTVAGPPVAPGQDPLYSATGLGPLAAITPGTVLRRREITSTVTEGASRATALQVSYRTVDELGRPSVTVTTIFVPDHAATPTRLVAYLSFYDALGAQCDPSFSLAGGYAGSLTNQAQALFEAGLIGRYLAAGDIVTVPDYEGTALDWAAGQESGTGTLDGLRATEEALHLPADTEIGLTGYSGGSIAAEWASELAPRYAPGLNIVGVAEGGLPTDLAHNLAYVDGTSDWAGVIPAVLVSLSRAFDVDLTPYLSTSGRRVATAVRSECIGSFLASYPGLTARSLLAPRYRSVLAIPALRRIVSHVRMGTAPGHPRGPLFMAVGNSDGRGDGIMLAGDIEGLAHEYCAQGVPVDYTTYPGKSHDEALFSFEPDAMRFLADRFAGTPFHSNCASIGIGTGLRPAS